MLEKLRLGEQLEERYQNHKLSGVFEGYHECHIKGNLLLVYHIDPDVDTVTIFDLGSHSEMFE